MKTNQSAVTHREEETVARLPGEISGPSAAPLPLSQMTPHGVSPITLAGKISAARMPVPPPAPRKFAAIETAAGALIAAALYFVLSQPAPENSLATTPSAPTALIASGK